MQLDLHCHSKYSMDCDMDPKKIVRLAKRRGLDGIAITDHNETQGALEAIKYANGEILIIVGEEIFTSSGDILGLFLKERVTAFDAKEAIAHVKSQGGVVVKPHPFADTMSLEEEVCEMLDGCEGFNARHATVKSCDNQVTEPKILELAKEYDLTLTASSDAHFYPEIGNGRTIVSASNLEEARQQLLNGNTVLWGKRSSRFLFFKSGLLKSLKSLVDPVPEAREHSREVRGNDKFKTKN